MKWYESVRRALTGTRPYRCLACNSRFWRSRYVDGQEKRVGLDLAALDPLIDRRVAAAREPGAGPPLTEPLEGGDPPNSD